MIFLAFYHMKNIFWKPELKIFFCLRLSGVLLPHEDDGKVCWRRRWNAGEAHFQNVHLTKTVLPHGFRQGIISFKVVNYI